jgi:hypothetical protein
MGEQSGLSDSAVDVTALQLKRHAILSTALPFPKLDWTFKDAESGNLNLIRDYSESLANSGSMPIQMIAGNGGTKLDKLYPLLQPPGTEEPAEKNPVVKREQDTSPPEVQAVPSWGIAGSNLVLMRHGFTVMQRLGTLWAATEFDRAGKKIAACQVSEALSPKPSEPTACEALVTQASSD